MVRFLINLPEDLRDDLRTMARPRGQTLNGLIRQILWEWIKKEQYKKEPSGEGGEKSGSRIYGD